MNFALFLRRIVSTTQVQVVETNENKVFVIANKSHSVFDIF